MFFFFDASPNKTYLSTDLQLTTPPYYYKQPVQKSSCKNLLDAKFLRFGHSIAYPRNGEKGEKIFMKISLFSNYFVLSNLPEELPVTNFWSLANEKVVTHWHNEKSHRVLQQLTKFLIQEMKIWNNLNIFFFFEMFLSWNLKRRLCKNIWGWSETLSRLKDEASFRFGNLLN